MGEAVDQPEQGGFFDLPKSETCWHPEHNFPTGLYVPPGKGYRHVCPGCGRSQVVHGSTAYLMASK